MQPATITITLPDWTQELLPALPGHYASSSERMQLVLELARRNCQEDTGGPFAAAVFAHASGQLVSIGVNRVVATPCSSAHAEIVALSLAQQRLGSYDLGAPGLPAHELVVNWRPCAMCLGALLWSGVRVLSIAGSGPELESLTGFDEGPIHPQWKKELHRRGIRLQEDILRDEALEIFRWFASSGRQVYNSRQS